MKKFETITYQQACIRTKAELKVPVNIVSADLLHAALGVASEAGELADQVKKHFFYGRPLDRINLMEEAGDVMWYLALLLTYLGTDFATVMECNIEKLKVRYPDTFKDVIVRNTKEELAKIKQ